MACGLDAPLPLCFFGDHRSGLLADHDRRRVGTGIECRRHDRSVSGAQPLQLDNAQPRSQAAIIACHAEARTAEDTNWRRIAALYADLSALVRSPIVELNRAIAIGMAEGPDRGLAIVDRLLGEPALEGYHLLPSVRGDLLHKLGRYEEARAAFEAAARLAGNRREQELLRRRAAKAADAAMSS